MVLQNLGGMHGDVTPVGRVVSHSLMSPLNPLNQTNQINQSQIQLAILKKNPNLKVST